MPQVTIGVTAYRRPEMLKECLASILAQTYQDFTVLVSNDDPFSPISPDSVGTSDERIQIVNQTRNLGEAANLNWLLSGARSPYFTWLADDDAYAPNYLEVMMEAMLSASQPACAFSGFQQGEQFPCWDTLPESDCAEYTGVDFLQRYLSREIRTLGVYGLFRKDYLLRCGGLRQLGKGFSPYSDHLLVIQAGLEDRVPYVGTPLVFFRTHSDSISFTSPDLRAFVSAQADLVAWYRRSFGNKACFGEVLALVLKWFVDDMTGLLLRISRFKWGDLSSFGRLLLRTAPMTGSVWRVFRLFAYTIRKAARALTGRTIGVFLFKRSATRLRS